MRRFFAYFEKILAVVFVVLALGLLWQAVEAWVVSGYVERARFAFHSGLYNAALTQLDEALRKEETAGLHLMRGSVQAVQMEFASAAEEFLKALRAKPTSQAAKIGRASSLLELADSEEGKKAAKKRARARALLEGAATGDAKVALAALALTENRIREAEQCLMAAKATGLTYHGLIAYNITRSIVESHLGHHEEALACARKAILLLPKPYGYSPRKCGGTYHRAYTDAIRSLILAAIRYVRTATHDSYPKIAAEIERNFGEDADRNFGIVARFWKDRPETFLVYLAMGKEAYRVGRYEEALSAFREAWRRCPKKRPRMMRVILLNRAQTNLALSRQAGLRAAVVRERLREAATTFAQVALDRRAPRQLRYWSHLAAAQCLFEMRDYSGARRHAEQAFDLADIRAGLSPTPALLAMAVCADREGKTKTAINLYKRLLVADDLKERNEVERRIQTLKEHLQRRKRR